jgi:hypothetical protein
MGHLNRFRLSMKILNYVAFDFCKQIRKSTDVVECLAQINNVDSNFQLKYGSEYSWSYFIII